MVPTSLYRRLIGGLTGLLLAFSIGFARSGADAPASPEQSSLPIHGHPQKAAYLSPDEWPEFDAQCHWSPSGLDPSVEHLGHLHVGVKAPLYAEIGAGPITVPVTVQMFRLAGRLDGSGIGIFGKPSSIVWDATGTSQPPVVEGDPDGLIVMTGQLTFDLDADTSRWKVLHGWAELPVVARVELHNGDRIDTFNEWLVYSVLDTSVSPTGVSSANGFINTKCMFRSARSPGTSGVQQVVLGQVVGSTNVDVPERHLIPLAPISAPWPLTAAGSSYSAHEGLDEPVGSIWLNPNLHQGHDGTLVAGPFMSGNINTLLPYTIDPAVLGEGLHSFLYRFHTTTGAGSVNFVPGEIGEALLLVKSRVADGVPPPPPPDPCSTPLSVTVTQWPGSQPGTHGWQYTSSHELTMVVADFAKVTALDICGRPITVNR